MQIDERNFIQALQRGQEEALDYVIDVYIGLIKGIVVKTLGPFHKNDVAHECCNDVLLAVWRHANSFEGDATDFRKWLAVIAKFKALDYYRRAVRQAQKTAAADPQHVLELYIEPPLPDYDIDVILRELKPLDQRIFIMYYLLELSAETIAAQLQLTKSAVDNRLYYGKKKLRQAGGTLIEKTI